jgi:glutamate--cysteine ligase catalytic subunit
LTAATPILRGYLVDTDVRWHVIEASVDDRTEEEMKSLSKRYRSVCMPRLTPSRYASVSSYIGIDESQSARLNDVALEQELECLDRLLGAGMRCCFDSSHA